MATIKKEAPKLQAELQHFLRTAMLALKDEIAGLTNVIEAQQAIIQRWQYYSHYSQ